ncbi:hypothetical protein MBCUT_03180 [Methanobrevibacter cuticularis]|uniref:B box-type domain-containing protein n=1 Tax=Methanobrevibacter cuticularis TaxID=47311 RepID=A0A166F383_9EURY|nr:B-box zinc finger protein [Methanobrevibacter cuticularis]KZX17271.1 hypothetical protein MBCUT_03180 [Methanobrevibacter cuticularis]
MNCQNHPEKEAVANCQFCGKNLCEDCKITIAGRNYCQDCMSELVGPELTDLAINKRETSASEIPDQTNETLKETPAKDVQDTFNDDYEDLYSDNRIYDDAHNITPEIAKENIGGTEELPNERSDITPNKNIEEKYEKYLDDLYFDEKTPKNVRDEKNLSLSEQLAIDEEENGPITKNTYIPPETTAPREIYNETEDDQINKQKGVPILDNLRKSHDNDKKSEQYTPHSLHRRIQYKNDTPTPFSSLEKILTILLIVLIILVVSYIIFLVTLSSNYPSFFDAIQALFTNPGELINNIFS